MRDRSVLPSGTVTLRLRTHGRSRPARLEMFAREPRAGWEIYGADPVCRTRAATAVGYGAAACTGARSGPIGWPATRLQRRSRRPSSRHSKIASPGRPKAVAYGLKARKPLRPVGVAARPSAPPNAERRQSSLAGVAAEEHTSWPSRPRASRRRAPPNPCPTPLLAARLCTASIMQMHNED